MHASGAGSTVQQEDHPASVLPQLRCAAFCPRHDAGRLARHRHQHTLPGRRRSGCAEAHAVRWPKHVTAPAATWRCRHDSENRDQSILTLSLPARQVTLFQLPGEPGSGHQRWFASAWERFNACSRSGSVLSSLPGCRPAVRAMRNKDGAAKGGAAPNRSFQRSEYLRLRGLWSRRSHRRTRTELNAS